MWLSHERNLKFEDKYFSGDNPLPCWYVLSGCLCHAEFVVLNNTWKITQSRRAVMKFTAFLIFCVSVHRPKVKSKVCTQELTSQVAHHAGTYLERCFKRKIWGLTLLRNIFRRTQAQANRARRASRARGEEREKKSRSYPRARLALASIRLKYAKKMRLLKPGETRTKHSPHAQATSSTAEIALILIFPLGLTLESTKGIYTPGENVGKSREIV